MYQNCAAGTYQGSTGQSVCIVRPSPLPVLDCDAFVFLDWCACNSLARISLVVDSHLFVSVIFVFICFPALLRVLMNDDTLVKMSAILIRDMFVAL